MDSFKDLLFFNSSFNFLVSTFSTIYWVKPLSFKYFKVATSSYFNGDITREDINKLIESLSSTQREVFEVEITKGSNGYYVTKYCCRIPFNNDQDFVVAIRPRYEKGGNILSMVVTGWLNHQEDAHYTLDESKYVSEKEYKKVV